MELVTGPGNLPACAFFLIVVFLVFSTYRAVYRPGIAKFTPQNINPKLCTHIIYAFGGLSSKYEMKAFDQYNDINQGKRFF